MKTAETSPRGCLGNSSCSLACVCLVFVLVSMRVCSFSLSPSPLPVTYAYGAYSYTNTFSGATVTEVNTTGLNGPAWAATYTAVVHPVTGAVTYTAVAITTNPGYATCAACVNVAMTFVPGCSAVAAAAGVAGASAAALFPSGSGLYTLAQNAALSTATGYGAAQTNCVSLTVNTQANTGTLWRSACRLFSAFLLDT